MISMANEIINKEKLIVVLSRNYPTGLSVVRSLGAVGYTIDLVASAYKAGRSEIVASSKYVRDSVEVVAKKVKDGEDIELVNKLLEYKGKYDYKPVLFPTDDYTTSVMDLNRSKLDDIFIMPSIIGGGEGSLTKCMDKTFQGMMARKAGLLTPKEWIISLEDNVIIPNDMIYPCFCKPIESITGYKREMAVCKNRKALKKHLNKLRDNYANRSILVQEFLEIDNEIDLSGVCFDQEIIIPAIIKKTSVAKHEKGVTLAGKIVPFEEIEEIKENIISMLKDFHYVGMFDMELNIVDDKIYFNEVNLRSGGPNFSYFMSGVNLPALFVNEAFGGIHNKEDEQVDVYGKTFIYEQVAWDDYLNGFMTKKELDELLINSDIKLLCNNDDPKPGRIFMKGIFKRRVKRRVKRIKKSFSKRYLKKVVKNLKQIILRYPQVKSKNKRDLGIEKPRVLIVGRDYCSNLCMARSLGEAGYEVEVLRVLRKQLKKSNVLKTLRPEAYSKYVKAYYIFASKKDKRVVKRLKQLSDVNNKMLLVPTDNRIAYIVHRYIKELCKFYIIPNADKNFDRDNNAMKKSSQKMLASSIGLPVLNSCVIKAKNKKFVIPESINYPCFIKPNNVKTTITRKGRKCNNEKALKKALRKFSAKRTIELLIEDYIEIEKEYSVFGISANNGIIGSDFYITESEGKNNYKINVVAKESVFSSRTCSFIVEFIKALGLEGLYNFKFVKTSDGKTYFTELRQYFGEEEYAITQSGINLPGMFADYMLLHKPMDTRSGIEITGRQFINEKVLLARYIKGSLSLTEIRHIMKTKDNYFIKADDIRPYKHFKKFYLLILAKKNSLKFRKSLKRKLRQLKKIILRYPQTKKKNKRNSYSEKHRVMIVGNNYASNLSIAKSLGESGYEVEIMRIFRRQPRRSNIINYLKPDAYSKYVKAYYVCISKLNKKIVNRLKRLADKEHKMLLIPADARMVYVISKYYKELSEFYVIPNNSAISDRNTGLMKRNVQKILAANVGVPVLNGCIIKIRKGKFSIPENLNYPCFIRDNNIDSPIINRIKKCDDENTLRRELKRFSYRKHVEVLVEDYVEIRKQYSIFGICTKGNFVEPGFFVTVKEVKSKYKGFIATEEDFPSVWKQSLKDNIAKFVKNLNLEGIYNVKLYETNDGNIFFMELKLYAETEIYAFSRNGVNLPGMFAEYMFLHRAIDRKMEIDITEKSFINEKILLERYAKGRLNILDVKNNIKSADIHFIGDCNDKASRHFNTIFAIAVINRFKDKIKRKIRKVFRKLNKNFKKIARKIKYTILGYPQTKKENKRNPNSKFPRVIVSGRNYCSNLCMARSLGEAGYEVEVMRVFQTRPKKRDLLKMMKPEAYSKYVKAYYVCVSKREDRRIVDRLKRLGDANRKMLLIPTDDLIAYIADKYFEELSEFYIMPNINNNEGEITRLMDKGVQKKLALYAGIPVLNSCVIKTQNGKFNIPESINYPCFIKPNVSKNSAKKRMRKCDDREALRRTLKKFSAKKDIEMLVEDYVEIEKEYSILGLSTKDGVIGPGIFVAMEGGKKEHRGVAITGKMLSYFEMQPLVDNIIKFIETLNFDGLYDVDLIETVDGRIYFVELNMRFGSSGYAVTKSGVNLPGMFADYMILNKPINLDSAIKESGLKFVSEKILLEEFAKGRLSKVKVKNNMNETDIHFIKNELDAKPYRHFKKFYLIAALQKGLYKVMRR